MYTKKIRQTNLYGYREQGKQGILAQTGKRMKQKHTRTHTERERERGKTHKHTHKHAK